MEFKKERKIVYKGDLFELTSTIVYSDKLNKIRIFEKAHRPPGVRMLFIKNNKILLSREFRSELKEWDFRLPGGKVFDDFENYNKHLQNEKMFEEKLRDAVVRESIEEVGLIVDSAKMNFLHKSISGSSVKWDLYYYTIKDFSQSDNGQELEEGEKIDKPVWMTYDEVIEMCLSGQINEDRTVAVLLRFLLKK